MISRFLIYRAVMFQNIKFLLFVKFLLLNSSIFHFNGVAMEASEVMPPGESRAPEKAPKGPEKAPKRPERASFKS